MTTRTWSVFSSFCEMVSERITSSVITPPALRITCASPSSRSSIRYTSTRASMQVTTARRFRGLGGIGRGTILASEERATRQRAIAQRANLRDAAAARLGGEARCSSD
jgi:hypothetical protein